MPGALAQLVERDRLLRCAERRRPPPLALLRARSVELVADHAQRQELVALQAQDRLQALEVVLAEQPVAALRAARRQQPLVLEVADLRDRDVRELVAQPAHDLADPEEPLPGCASAGCRVACSSCDERHPVLADLQLVALLERRAVDAPAVDERAVQRALVLDRRTGRRAARARRGCGRR